MEAKASSNNLHLIVGDIGFGVFEEYIEKYPNDYLNIGICEANMIGMAAGMSRNDFTPIVYTIVPFLVMRPFEQIRIDLALQNSKVVLVGVGGGFSYGTLGPTHHSFEDIALMSLLPNFHVFAPSQPSESSIALSLALKHDGPSYIRLGKNGEPDLEEFLIDKQNDYKVYINDWQTSDATILTYGPITLEAIKAAKDLAVSGLKISVISFWQIKPLPESIIDICSNINKLFILEEHTSYNSPGTHIISILAIMQKIKNVWLIGVEDRFTDEVGSRDFVLAANNLDFSSVATFVRKKLS
tara:strand:- start:9883 stop:10776 length:894 start_codon:yes stop_codon:yes gene_type:complete